LPVLPDATPKLGVPSKPARLLPGLEESQGALYEIGVADDGTFVGLTQDELDESLTNLQSMAASLGCKVEVLRRVVVGRCEWAVETSDGPLDAPPDPAANTTEGLWVVEALVSPDLDFYNISPGKSIRDPQSAAKSEPGNFSALNEDYSHTEQIRISIAGPSTAGKSSLLGTLTSSALDNGRGKSRLSLLKHRHEISSGITSSVAQELIGYTDEAPPTVINYASGNVAGWDDIHAASHGGRLTFVSDLPGSVRYLKSTLRGLVSWSPHYVMLCIPANCGDETTVLEQGTEHSEIDLCLAYFQLCLKLELPVLIVITKLDVASRSGLRDNLAKILSAIKSANRKPAMLPASPASDKVLDLQQISTLDTTQVRKAIDAADGNWLHTVPIILTSALDGSGIGKLHAFLRYLPIPAQPPQRKPRIPKAVSISSYDAGNVFDVDEVFAIPPSKVYSIASEKGGEENRGMVLCGLVRHGSISIGDEVVIGPVLVDASNDSNTEPPPSVETLSRSGPGDVSASFPQSLLSGKDSQARWQRVRVVSVRDLRLPVRRLVKDQVGTIGIEPIGSSEDKSLPRLGRIRKGMVLSNLHMSPLYNTSIPLDSSLIPLPFHTGFTATFRSAEFSAPNSPPLLLGGNAIVYIANIRTAVRVICMALTGTGEELSSEPPSPTEPELFNFDSDAQPPSLDKPHTNGSTNGSATNNLGSDRITDAVRRRSSATDISKVISGTIPASIVGVASSAEALQEDVKITFALISSVEWIELGSQVLVMPGISMASASSQAAATVASGPGSGAMSMSGLEGFVGVVSEVVPGRVPVTET
jgi:GTPase